MPISWADFERFHPGCGAYWDLFWINRNQQQPTYNYVLGVVDRSLERDQLVKGALRFDLFIFDPSELEYSYSSPYKKPYTETLRSALTSITRQTHGKIKSSNLTFWKYSCYYYAPNDQRWLEFPVSHTYSYGYEGIDFNRIGGIQ